MNLLSPQSNETLVLDILPNIIKYLPLNDAGRFRAVCHTWRDVIDEYFKSVKVLYLRSRPQIETSASSSFRSLTLMRRSMGLDNIRTIHFNQILLRPSFSPNQQFAVILAKLFPNAMEFYFLDGDYWSDNNESFTEMCQELFSSLTGIKKLAIQTVYSDQIMDSIMQNLESLNTLIFFYPFIDIPARAIRFLDKLERFTSPQCARIVSVLGSSQNLKAISFRMTPDFDENTINLLSKDNFPNLRHVGLCLASSFPPGFKYLEVLRRLLSVNPGVSSLELYTDKKYCGITTKELSAPFAKQIIRILLQYRSLRLLTITLSFRCRPLLELLARKIKKFQALETICLQTQFYVDTEIMFQRFFPNLPKDRSPIIAGSPPKIVIENIESSSDSLIKDKLSEAEFAFPVEVKPMGFFLNV